MVPKKENYKKKIYVLKLIAIIQVLTLLSLLSRAEELVSLKDFLKKELSHSTKLSKEIIQLSKEQKEEVSKLAPNSSDDSYTFYYGKDNNGKMEKACTVIVQAGKEGHISLGTCFNSSGILDSVTILSHEEERGKKITSENFLKQFKGKKATDAFVLGSDMDGISGASYSSKSISEALRRSAFAFRTMIKGKENEIKK